MDENHYNLTSPTILITSALTVASWLILFIGACVAQFHGVPWWIIIFELAFVITAIVLLGVNKFYRFKHMIYLFMAVSLVYLTWLVQFTLDNDGDAGARAAAAGACMLIIAQFIWAICLTSPAGSLFSRNGSQAFKNSSVGVTGANLTRKFSNTVRNTTNNISSRKTPNSPLPPRGDEELGSPHGNTDFEQAIALHDYQGSAEDPNELSFSKNERLEILDKRGNWWQARKQDGTTGIVPSNYFQ